MSITVLPLSPFPTSAPVALGGSTPSVNIAAPRGLLSGKSTSGAAVVRLLVWNVALTAWDVVTRQGQQIQIVPDSSRPGGVDQVEFDVATPAYFAAQITTTPPENDIANLTCDIGLAPGASASGVAQIFSVLPGASATVHAAYNATDPNIFPGPITQPDVPRSIYGSASLGYDGGDITVTGTDALDRVISDTFTPGAGSGTAKAFKTITQLEKATVGTTGAVTVITDADTTTKYGVPFAVAGSYGIAQKSPSTSEPLTISTVAANNTVQFATAPTGAIRFTAVLQG